MKPIGLNITKGTLLQLVNERKTQREIAEGLNVSQSTIRYWLHKHGLKTMNRVGPRTDSGPYCCIECGETDVSKFYRRKRYRCKLCWDKYTRERALENRQLALDILGHKCSRCGYDEFDCSLDVHHLDSKKKDPNFRGMRGWSKARLIKELEGCELRCKNCHAAIHNGKDT
jgi:predicted transcriptional regulator